MTSNLTKIHGTLTSPLQLRGEKRRIYPELSKNTSEPYYYSFIRLKDQSIDLPVIFKTLVEPPLKKGTHLVLIGHYSTSEKNVRKSFTCSDYQVLAKRIRKKCSACGDNFTCSQSKNYYYCKTCSLTQPKEGENLRPHDQ